MHLLGNRALPIYDPLTALALRRCQPHERVTTCLSLATQIPAVALQLSTPYQHCHGSNSNLKNSFIPSSISVSWKLHPSTAQGPVLSVLCQATLRVSHSLATPPANGNPLSNSSSFLTSKLQLSNLPFRQISHMSRWTAGTLQGSIEGAYHPTMLPNQAREHIQPCSHCITREQSSPTTSQGSTVNGAPPTT